MDRAQVFKNLSSRLAYKLVLFFLICAPFGMASAQPDCRQNGPVSGLNRAACDLDNETHRCSEFFKKFPDSAKFARSCEKQETAPEWTSTCRDAVLKAWTGIWKSGNHLQEAMAACDQNSDCKQKLAKEAYYVCDAPGASTATKGYPCTNEKRLADVDSGDLIRKRESLRAEARRNPKSREFYIAHGASLPDLDNGLGEIPSIPITALLKEKLEKLGLQYDCLSAVGKSEILCSAVGHIFDPNLILAGVIGGAVARTYLAAAEDLSVARPLGGVTTRPSIKPEPAPAPAPIPEVPVKALVPDRSNFAKLQEIIEAQPRSEGGYIPLPHELVPIEGTDGFRLKIGYLSREKDKNFLKLLMVAVRDGKITEVEAGNVVGPKIVAMLEKMRSIKVRSGKGVKIFGNIEGKKVGEAQKMQIEHSARTMATGDEKKIAFLKRGSMYWTPEDVTDFSSGVKNLKWLEACKQFYGSATLETCGPLSFEVNSAHPDDVIWRKVSGN